MVIGETQLTLTADERQCLAMLLEQALKQVRVEEHRTRTLRFREHIVQQEELMTQLLQKLGPAE